MPSVVLKIPLLIEITGQDSFFVEGGSVSETLDNLEKKFPGFKSRLLTGEGGFQGYLIVVAKHAGSNTGRLVRDPRDDAGDLVDLSILPVPHGG